MNTTMQLRRVRCVRRAVVVLQPLYPRSSPIHPIFIRMSDQFELPVTYKNEELLFPAELISTGYTYKIIVDVSGLPVAFELDEERNFRAVLAYESMEEAHKIDKELMEEIANTLISIFKD